MSNPQQAHAVHSAQSIEQWRNRTVSRMLWILLGIASPALVLSIISRPPMEWMVLAVLYVGILVLAVVRRIPLQVKSVGIVFLLLLVSVHLTLEQGVTGAGHLFMTIAVVLAGCLMGSRIGMAFVLLSIVILAFCAWLVQSGNYATHPGAQEASAAAVNWLRFLLNYILAVTMIFFAVQFLLRQLTRNFEDLKRQAEDNRIAWKAQEISMRNFQMLAENATDVFWTMNLNAEFTYISSSVESVRGYTPEEAMHLDADVARKSSIKKLIHNELQHDAERDPKRSHTIVSRLECKGGRFIDAEVVISFLRDDNGAITGILGVTRDISERKQLEDAMDSVIQGTSKMMGKDFFGSLAQTLAETLEVKCVLIGAVPSEKTVTTLAVWMDGCAQENMAYDLEGTPCANVFQQSLCVYPEGVQALFPEDHLLVEMGMESYVGAPMVDSQQNTIGLLVCMDDKPLLRRQMTEDLLSIFAPHAAAELARRYSETEREKIREQLLQSQKLDSIGQLAGGIAHDFNNLLVVIHGYTDLAQDLAVGQTEMSEYHDEIRKAADRAAGLTRQLLSFSRRQIMETKPLDLNGLIQGMGGLLRRLLPENIEHEFIPGASLGVIEGDPGQLEQVLMNLAVNARDAMPGGGKLTIETENILFDQNYVDSQPWAKLGRYVSLRVADTGIGIPAEAQERIFEPFFTTKEEGKGTGLGLSVVFGVVKQHGGFLHVYSEPGKGTEFRTYLPIVERAAASQETKLASRPTRGNETLLLVEDDEQILKLASTVLSRAGYEVITAQDGEEAVQLFRAHQQQIALVLLDIVMPKMGGREVQLEIRKLAPSTPVLFTSGYADSGIHTDFILQDGLELLQKPYSSEALSRRVRELLG